MFLRLYHAWLIPSFLIIYMLGCPFVGYATYPDPPTEFINTTSEIFVATDQNGHAIAAYTDQFGFPTNRIIAYYFSDNNWEYMPIGIARGTVTGLAMSTNGKALITYVTDTFELRSVSFDGSVWFVPNTDPIAILSSDDGTGGGGVVMDSTDLGVVIWSDAITYDIRTSFFSGDWGPPSNPGDIGTGIYPICDISIATNGGVAMVAGWKDTSDTDIIISNYYAETWFGNTNLGPGTLGGVGIAPGRSVVVFQETGTQDIYGSYFNSITLGGTVLLNPLQPSGPANTIPRMGISSTGTAIATWGYINSGSSEYDLYYAKFDGATWLPAVNFQSGTTPSTPPVISVNTDGNGLIFWGNYTSPLEFYTAHVQALGVIETPVPVATSDSIEALPLGVSLANNGRFNALVWGEQVIDGDEFAPFGIASIQLPAPTGLSFVDECPNRNSDSQGICSIRISWDMSDDPSVASYNIERNGVFIANQPIAFGSEYTDDMATCGAPTVYSIAAVDLDGVPGVEASIIIE